MSSAPPARLSTRLGIRLRTSRTRAAVLAVLATSIGALAIGAFTANPAAPTNSATTVTRPDPDAIAAALSTQRATIAAFAADRDSIKANTAYFEPVRLEDGTTGYVSIGEPLPFTVESDAIGDAYAAWRDYLAETVLPAEPDAGIPTRDAAAAVDEAFLRVWVASEAIAADMIATGNRNEAPALSAKAYAAVAESRWTKFTKAADTYDSAVEALTAQMD